MQNLIPAPEGWWGVLTRYDELPEYHRVILWGQPTLEEEEALQNSRYTANDGGNAILIVGFGADEQGVFCINEQPGFRGFQYTPAVKDPATLEIPEA